MGIAQALRWFGGSSPGKVRAIVAQGGAHVFGRQRRGGRVGRFGGGC
jgi:hypothetical protein